MFRKTLLLISLLFCTMMQAQVLVEARIDSMQMFIGQQANITLDITMGAKQKLELPPFKNGTEIIPNVEIVTVQRPDTTFLDDGSRMEISQVYTITAWDTDSTFYYHLPKFVVKVDGKPYESKSLAIKVYSMDVDTLHVDQFFPPNGVMEPPFAWEDWRLVVLASFLLIIMLGASVVIWYYAVNGKPIVRFIRRKKKLPPHKVAMSEIERIKADRKWAEEDSKEYYTQLTDTLRTYIRERYGFNAMEMTSNEIIERLVEENDEEALNELRDIFRTADLVKFAKYSTLLGENDANLVSAIEYIDKTKVEVDPNAKQEPEVIRETDEKRMNQIRIMRICVCVLTLLSAVLLVWIVWRSADILL